VRSAGFDCEAMEDWAADPRAPKDFSQKRILDCDVVVLLVARRRGFIPPEENRSITQLEYECAIQNVIDVIPFILADDAPWPVCFDERERDRSLLDWVQMLRLAHGCPKDAFLGGHVDLALSVVESLTRWERQRPTRLTFRRLPSPLPIVQSQLVGRDKDLSKLVGHFNSGVRSVTVFAPGGFGKTRVSIAAAERWSKETGRRAVFAELRECQTTVEMLYTVASALGAAVDKTNDLSRVVELLLSSYDGILVLDNFEQLESSAALEIEKWIHANTDSVFLITSTRRLGFHDETVFVLDSLSTKSIHGAPSSSLQLFSNACSRFGVEVIANEINRVAADRICERLGGQPLLLEIAASRLKILSLQELADQIGSPAWLDALHTREKSFRRGGAAVAKKTIEWSFSLLSEEAKGLFVRSCVFHGGFTISALREVCDRSGNELNHFEESLEELIDGCFLRHGGNGRLIPYASSIDEFGFERMKSLDITKMGMLSPFEAWGAHFEDVAKRAVNHLFSSNERKSLQVLELDRENILEAQLWSIQNRNLRMSGILADCATQLLLLRGPLQLAIERLTRTLAFTDASQAKGSLLLLRSEAYYHCGDFSSALNDAKSALEIADALHAEDLKAAALFAIGQSCTQNLDDTLLYCSRSKARYEALMDGSTFSTLRVVECSLRIATSLDRQGLSDQAFEYFSELTPLVEHLGSDLVRAKKCNGYGLLLWHVGRCREAIAEFSTAERISRELGNLQLMAGAMTNRGLALTDLARYDDAIRSFEASSEYLSQIGNRAWFAVNRGGLGFALARSGKISEGLRYLTYAEQLAMQAGNKEDAAMHAGFAGRIHFSAKNFTNASESFQRAFDLEGDANIALTVRQMCNRSFACANAIQLGENVTARIHLQKASEIVELRACYQNQQVPEIAMALNAIQDCRRLLLLDNETRNGSSN
jgi:tetratricopeptide (TPR) repeat protein